MGKRAPALQPAGKAGGAGARLEEIDHTYTILKRLCERGLFQNEGGQVSSLVSREEFQAAQSEQFVEEAFGGSLPAFVAAFGSRRRLTDSELDELERLVESMRG